MHPILQVVDLLKKKRDMTFNEVSFVIYLFSDLHLRVHLYGYLKEGLMFALVSSFLDGKIHQTVSISTAY